MQAAAVADIEFVAAAGNQGSAATTSLIIDKPSGTVEGNAMVCVIHVNFDDVVVTPPSGWTSIEKSNGNSGQTGEMFYKKAGASEPSSYEFTFGTSTRRAGVICSFSGSFDADFIDVSAVSFNTSSSASDRAYSPSVTTTVDDTMLIYAAGYDGSSTTGTYTPASGFTEAHETTGQAKAVMGYKLQESAGSTGTINTTVNENLFMVKFTVAIKQNI